MLGECRRFCIAAGLFIAAAPAYAISFQTTHLATDQDMLDRMGNRAFVAEGRIGNNNPTNGDYELDIHSGDPIVVRAQANYQWTSGLAVPFELTYDATWDKVTFRVGGGGLAERVLEYLSPGEPFTDIFVRTRAVEADWSMVVDNLVLNGTPVGDGSQTDPADGLDILWIHAISDPLVEGFTLTGQSTMTWPQDDLPWNSRLAYQLKIAGPVEPGPAVPEANTMAGLAGALAAAVAYFGHRLRRA